MIKTAILCGFLLLGAPGLNAQQKPNAKEAQPPQAKQDAAALERAQMQNGQPVNMRLDLTMTDDRGNGQAISKTVSILTADRFWGRIRTAGEITTSDQRRLPVILNVDARPTLIRDNRARVEMTIEYRPSMEALVAPPAAPGARPDASGLPPNVNESLAVILEDGKPLLISQSADPITDRTVKVEAKLSILR
jgi:hypothetical protein